MKVALVTPGWPPASFANGIASYIGHLHEGLGKLGVESRVLAQSVGEANMGSDIVDLSSTRSPATVIARMRGIYSRYISPNSTWTSMVQRECARSILSGIEHLLPSFQPDILEMDESFGAAGIVARRLNIPVVVRLHGPYFINAVAMGDVKNRAYHHRAREERNSIMAASGITVPSADLLERVRQEYSADLANAEVIPNAAPTVSETKLWRQQDADNNLILFVGRFDRHKGGDLVLEAFARVAAKRPMARLLFIGPDANYRTSDGRSLNLRGYLDQFIRDESTRARVTHLGQLPAAEIRPHRLKAALTVVASRYENFPMTVLEALAHGCPLIAPSTGGVPEIVTHEKNGLLFAQEDIEGLAQGITRLLDEPERAIKLGRQGADDVRMKFSALAVARRTKMYYERVLENRFN